MAALLAASVTTACGGGERPGRGPDPVPSTADGAILAANNNSCWLTKDGRAKCWGEGSQGQLGHGDTNTTWGKSSDQMGAGLPVVDLGAGRTARAMVGEVGALCALLDNGEVKCWGWNVGGMLGLGDRESRGDEPGEMGDALPSLDLGAGLTVKSLAGGGYEGCAVFAAGQLKCWGANGYGQLGLGDQLNRGDDPGEMGDALPFVDLGAGRTVKTVVIGAAYACALLDNSQVKCWGRNESGELGDSVEHGGHPGEMGDALPQVNLGTGRSVKAISAGYSHTCALLDNDQIKCWGRNDEGQLGLGDKLDRGAYASEMGDALPFVDLGAGRSAKAVASGGNNTCVILDNDKIKCWGSNISGQLGLGDVLSRGDDPGEMGDALPVVSLGTDSSARTVYVGALHVCASLDGGGVKCWGNNGFGQLGLASAASGMGGQPGEMGDALPLVDVGQ